MWRRHEYLAAGVKKCRRKSWRNRGQKWQLYLFNSVMANPVGNQPVKNAANQSIREENAGSRLATIG